MPTRNADHNLCCLFVAYPKRGRECSLKQWMVADGEDDRRRQRAHAKEWIRIDGQDNAVCAEERSARSRVSTMGCGRLEVKMTLCVSKTVLHMLRCRSEYG